MAGPETIGPPLPRHLVPGNGVLNFASRLCHPSRSEGPHALRPCHAYCALTLEPHISNTSHRRTRIVHGFSRQPGALARSLLQEYPTPAVEFSLKFLCGRSWMGFSNVTKRVRAQPLHSCIRSRLSGNLVHLCHRLLLRKSCEIAHLGNHPEFPGSDRRTRAGSSP